MDNILFQHYHIADRSYVSYVKREIHNLIKPAFSVNRAGEVDIVVSEMTSNLIKYAQRGELLYRLSEEEGAPVFEVICIDNGEGIKDLPYSMKDGISSRNTLGHGLGSIVRLSNLAQVYSLPNWGTVIYSRFYNDLEHQSPKKNVAVRCLNVAKPGEQVSGDGVSIRLLRDKTLVMAGDGLGHGVHAKEAVDKATQIFKETSYSDPSDIVKQLNAGVKKTRGLVATVAVLDHRLKICQICGIGNIQTRIVKGLEFKNYIGNNGIIGLNIPGRVENASFDVEKPQQLIFCSDGIKTKWDLVRYPNISRYDPMITAAVLYKDYARQTDDMTILIVRLQ